MSQARVVPQLLLGNVRKIISAGVGACRIRVTVLSGVSLQLMPGEAVAITGSLPLARSMLCAIAAGVARCDAGSVRWGLHGLAGVRYAPAGDAPRALRPRPDAPPSLAILDAALVEHAPPPDLPTIVELLEPWLEAGGAALVAAPVTPQQWPWWILELAGGRLRPVVTRAAAPAAAWSAPARMVAEGVARRVAHGAGDQ